MLTFWLPCVYVLIICSNILSYKTAYISRWVSPKHTVAGFAAFKRSSSKVYCSTGEENEEYDEKSTGKKKTPRITPEFSRMISISQIPKRGSIACRLLAKAEERQSIAKRLRFGVRFELKFFAANATIEWKNPQSLLIKGKYEAHQNITSTYTRKTMNSFETLLHYTPPITPPSEENTRGKKRNDADSESPSNEKIPEPKYPPPKKLDEYDDDVPEDGNVDIGEIATQYYAIDHPYPEEFEVF